MKINAYVISSGSKGNATLIYTENTSILVDLGINIKKLESELRSISKDVKDIDYALFTHDHSDHIKYYNLIDESKRYSVDKVIPLDNAHTLSTLIWYQFGSFEVMPIPTSHDGINNCGYIFKTDTDTLVYITDTGYIKKDYIKYIKNATYYIIELNYDKEMLFNSARPTFLKRRINGRKGHLSNVQSASYLSKLIGTRTKKVMYAHLSEVCNTPALCIKTHNEIYSNNKIDCSHIEFICASQNGGQSL